MQCVAIDRLVRLAIPGHPAAKTLIELGNGAGTGLDMPTAHDDPVGIEAVHVNVAVGMALEVGAIILGVGALLGDPGASEVSEELARGQFNAASLEDCPVAARTDETDRSPKRSERLD